MYKELLTGLSKILGPIATLSKDRRELKDSALRAISNALTETSLYYRDLERGLQRSNDREDLLVKYWSAAAILIRHFDENLASVCEHKSEYWINPERFNNDNIREMGIALEDVRHAYRMLLSPSYTRR